MNYQDILERKKVRRIESGFDARILIPRCSTFSNIASARCSRWAGAIFAGCGNGKTLMQLEWGAKRVAEHEDKPVLVLPHLSQQADAHPRGCPLRLPHCPPHRDRTPDDKLVITNYEQIENINREEFIGVVLDESSILKNYTGHYKRLLIEVLSSFLTKAAALPHPSPNDLNEIGNHSECS